MNAMIKLRGHLTNRKNSSMVCTLIDHRIDVKMFKTQVTSMQSLQLDAK